MANKKAFALRIHPAILESVQRWADDELRSVNAQIEYLLRDALRQAGRLNSPDSTGSPSRGDATDSD